MSHPRSATLLFTIKNVPHGQVTEADVCTSGFRMFGPSIIEGLRPADLSDAECKDLLLRAGMNGEDVLGLFSYCPPQP